MKKLLVAVAFALPLFTAARAAQATVIARSTAGPTRPAQKCFEDDRFPNGEMMCPK